MVKHKENEGQCFRAVTGRKLVLNLTKSHGSLIVSLDNELNLSRYRNTLLLGFPLIVATMFVLNLAYLAIFIFVLLPFILYEMLSIKEEKLLIVKGLGYQIFRKFFIRTTISFIPYETVQKIFINEVILRHKVVYIINLLVQEGAKQPKLVPLFSDILPKLDCLEVIYRNIRCFKDS